MNRNEIILLCSGVLFGFGAGMIVGYMMAINMLVDNAMQIFRESGIQIDSEILNQMIRYGFSRMGL